MCKWGEKYGIINVKDKQHQQGTEWLVNIKEFLA